MSSMDENIKLQAEEAALLNILMYLNMEHVEVEDGWSISRIINKLGTIYGSKKGYERYCNIFEGKATQEDYKDRQRQYEILKNACKTNKHFANLKIGNQSRFMDDFSHKRGGLNACTFEDAEGNIHVVYRGTGPGEWIDNGIALSGLVIESKQQKEAAEYFDYIVEKNNYYKKDINIQISGHSKGGNKAQYTTINAKYRELINICFNFDGQGMSPEAIKAFKYRHEDYDKSINKMYGIYAENDYVNPLGIPIIPKENRFYFESTIDMNGVKDNKKYHYAYNYLNLDGTFSEITKQGHISKVIENLSLEICMLPPKIRARAINIAMKIMQGDEVTVNGEIVKYEYNIGGGTIAIGLLLFNLASTLEGWDTVDELGGDLLVTIGDKYGPVAELEAAAILAYLIPSLFIDDLLDISIGNFTIVVKKAMEVMEKLGNLLITKLEQIGKKLLETGIYIGNQINKFAMDVGKALVKLNNFITGLYNNVIIVGKRSGIAIREFGQKATAAVSSFFIKVGEGARTFSSMLIKDIKATGAFIVDKGQKVNKLVEKNSIRIKEQSKSFAKRTFKTVKAGINIVPGKRVLKQRKLSVNFNRLEDMQRKTKDLELQLEEQIYKALNEVERLISGVGYDYDEYYIRQQINTINNLCRQLIRDGNSTCHRIQKSTNSLQYALSYYKQIEQSLCKDIRKITVYT